MSNLSLKDQLQALALTASPNLIEKPSSTSSHFPQAPVRQNRPEKSSSKTSKPINKQKPAWLEYAQYGVELLKAYFPLCFKDIKEIQPLKVGIKQDLVKQLATLENIVISDKACMVTSLAYYVNSAAYHKNMVEGAVRIDLEGNSAGAVTVEEAKYAEGCRQAKMQKKKPATLDTPPFVS